MNVGERFDVSKLESKDIRRRCNIEMRNRFKTLHCGENEDPEVKHDMIWAKMQRRESRGGQRNLVDHR